ncbi:hypothetical protein ICN18_04425 [Polynucleobacter sp. Ross1-W9]|uniref:hypothetical protein n=1 Tax=Polynucleobacter parvulilacunae TaxID=1855631 RepID=UPI001C0E0692|nr:hypothetical protein [Polynucleobacter parvulilacunae]MBU3556869.1 hypothetical protein [Polynucleobacter parvulilacunae]
MKNINYIPVVLFAVTLSAYAEDTSVNIATQTGNTLGLTVSGYQYKEPSLSVVINAPLVGVDYTGTYAFANDWFVKADARYAYGSAKYTGSGTQSNIPYSYYDLRGLFGYDFSFSELGGFVLAPYTGLGYRYLFDNQAGQTSSGANSYNRSSNYVYLPIGVTHRMKINDVHKLETNFEYDYLIQGTQVSHLSQAAPNLPDITNQQFRGYGLRLSSMYQFAKWSVGPYITYWNIQNSNAVTQTITANRVNYRLTAYEPANNTVEAGIKVAYSF